LLSNRDNLGYTLPICHLINFCYFWQNGFSTTRLRIRHFHLSRHKDNRNGGVTEFVELLKKELEATFKEDLSIYFDSNAHDGLLENHNVDKSLNPSSKKAHE